MLLSWVRIRRARAVLLTPWTYANSVRDTLARAELPDYEGWAVSFETTARKRRQEELTFKAKNPSFVYGVLNSRQDLVYKRRNLSKNSV